MKENRKMNEVKVSMLNDESVDLEVYQQTENTITFSNEDTDIISNIWFDLQEVR